MVEERVYVERHPGAHLLGALFVSLIIIVAALWMLGVMTVDRNGSRAVITFDFSKAEEASEDAAEKAGKALEHAGEKLREKTRPNEEPAAPKAPASNAPMTTPAATNPPAAAEPSTPAAPAGAVSSP